MRGLGDFHFGSKMKFPYKILIGDCLDHLDFIDDESFQCCVTSPPYFGLRDYGHEKQIGLEVSPEHYIARLVEVFREVRRVLKKDGTLWLNIGDSYARTGGTDRNVSATAAAGNTKATIEARGDRKQRTPEGLKDKDLIGIPWMLAFALRSDGWYLRQDIIWHKPNAMPESVRDRCTKAHEYVFLLSKSGKYFIDPDGMREAAVKGASGSSFNTGKTAIHQMGRSSDLERADDGKRNRRSVWSVPTRPYKGAHFATFPPDLIEPCILAGSRPGDVVFDPFGGSGTTAEVAIRHGRRPVVCELNPEYAPLIEDRVQVALSDW